MDSGIITPEVRQEVDAMVAALASDANAEVNAEVMEQKSRSLTVAAAESGEVGPSNAPSRAHSPRPALVDNEGDVEMSEMRETLSPGFHAKNQSRSPAAATAADPAPQIPISPANSVLTSVPATAELMIATAPLPEPTEIKKEGNAPVSDGDMIMWHGSAPT
jgi:histone deacetylase 1/2